ncbi:protein LNK2-like isoform X5 [Primulina huaijiensis]|uniref:protein LNK2-like isoform X5 n=1 Tax=Primulina huaijiensis TaxID=1492673 RepID=UPI003CC7675C
MAMFDWNDEELTNIIWGEAREIGDDHIVPYPDQNEENRPVLSDHTKKDMNHEIARVSPIEQKKHCTNTEHGVEVVGSCKYGIHDPPSKGFSNARPDGSDLAITNIEKVDQDSMGTAASNNMMTTKDATGQIDKVYDFLQNPPEDREQGDFVDYGWANIGSFDDLDRIFRNDPICGVMNCGGSVDEPWLSSQDGSEIGAEFTLDCSHSFVAVNETFKEIKSHVGQDEQTFEIGENSEACQKKPDGGRAAIMNELSEKGNNKKRLPKGHKCQKSEEKNEIRHLHDLGYARSSRASPSQLFSIHYAPSMVNQYPPLVLSQQWQSQRAEPFQQKQCTGPLLSSSLYGNVFHYPAMSIVPQFHPVEGNHENGNANSPKNSVDGAVKPPTMTPKEKIEKLRRCQQSRAILAIQKQQQQFGNHLSVEYSTMEGENIEVYGNLSTLLSLDHSTSTEVNDSNAVSIPFGNRSVEESVFYQLQETISKLDIQIRLSIRDSLFRLAQSAIKRQRPSDRGSINSRDEVLSKDIDTHERTSTISDEETNTNPIDRTVAHLLFRRPLELSGKLYKKHDSPVSAYISHERKPRTLESIERGHFPDTFEKAQVESSDESKTFHVYFDKDQSKNSPRLDTPQNMSNIEAETEWNAMPLNHYESNFLLFHQFITCLYVSTLTILWYFVNQLTLSFSDRLTDTRTRSLYYRGKSLWKSYFELFVVIFSWFIVKIDVLC